MKTMKKLRDLRCGAFAGGGRGVGQLLIQDLVGGPLRGRGRRIEAREFRRGVQVRRRWFRGRGGGDIDLPEFLALTVALAARAPFNVPGLTWAAAR